MSETQRHCKRCNSPLALNEKAEVCAPCRSKHPEKKELVENVDYYIENGFFVFTEKYHLDRGYCCGSGCRHCPYKR